MQILELLISLVYQDLKEGSVSAHRLLIHMTGTAAQIYHTTALVLFAISSYATASILNSIHKEIESSEGITFVNCDPLENWKLRHLLACDTADAINDCFGWTLLLSTKFILIAIINESYYVLGDQIETNSYEISYIFTYAIQICLICFPPHELHIQVIILLSRHSICYLILILSIRFRQNSYYMTYCN